MKVVDHGWHLNPQTPSFLYTRTCAFCKQMDLTGEHARACPGKPSDIRGWTESATDKNGDVIGDNS